MDTRRTLLAAAAAALLPLPALAAPLSRWEALRRSGEWGFIMQFYKGGVPVETRLASDGGEAPAGAEFAVVEEFGRRPGSDRGPVPPFRFPLNLMRLDGGPGIISRWEGPLA